MDVFHLGFRALHVFNTWVASWQEALLLYVWKPSSSREHCNSLHKELLVSSRLLCWLGKERLQSHFNRLFCLEVKEVGDIVEA